MADKKTFLKELSTLIGSMAASVDGCSYRMDLPWPLHRALVALYDRAGSCGLGDRLPTALVVKAIAEAGRGVERLENQVLPLMIDGSFLPTSSDERLLVVNPDAIPRLRRNLLGEDVDLARLIHRAALLWATDCSTCEKNWATARASWAPTVSSETPNPLQLVAGVL